MRLRGRRASLGLHGIHQPGWPADAAGQALFDPLWGIDDPAAGAWFPQQALQLAQDAAPALP